MAQQEPLSTQQVNLSLADLTSLATSAGSKYVAFINVDQEFAKLTDGATTDDINSLLQRFEKLDDSGFKAVDYDQAQEIKDFIKSETCQNFRKQLLQGWLENHGIEPHYRQPYYIRHCFEIINKLKAGETEVYEQNSEFEKVLEQSEIDTNFLRGFFHDSDKHVEQLAKFLEQFVLYVELEQHTESELRERNIESHQYIDGLHYRGVIARVFGRTDTRKQIPADLLDENGKLFPSAIAYINDKCQAATQHGSTVRSVRSSNFYLAKSQKIRVSYTTNHYAPRFSDALYRHITGDKKTFFKHSSDVFKSKFLTIEDIDEYTSKLVAETNPESKKQASIYFATQIGDFLLEHKLTAEDCLRLAVLIDQAKTAAVS